MFLHRRCLRLTALSLVALFSCSFPAEQPTAAGRPVEVAHAVSFALERNGSAKVLINLAPAGLADADLDRLTQGTGFALRRRYRRLPLIAASIDAEGLQLLRHLVGSVESIEIDQEGQAHLTEAVRWSAYLRCTRSSG